MNSRACYIFLPFIFFLTANAYAQVIHGTVVNDNTGEPLVYVNIGVIGTNAGTLSNNKGEFKLTVRTQNDTLKIRFTMIGYEARVIPVKELHDGMIVRLSETKTILKEVVVSSSGQKTSRLGSSTSTKSMVTGWGGFGSGGERGIKITSKKYPVYPKSIGFNIAQNNYDSILLRLHIRSLKNGLPAEEILTENVFIKVKLHSGLTEVDISQYNLEIDHDFAISLEWITAWGECKERFCMVFSLNRFGGTMFAKTASESPWEEIKRNSPGIFVDFIY